MFIICNLYALRVQCAARVGILCHTITGHRQRSCVRVPLDSGQRQEYFLSLKWSNERASAAESDCQYSFRKWKGNVCVQLRHAGYSAQTTNLEVMVSIPCSAIISRYIYQPLGSLSLWKSVTGIISLLATAHPWCRMVRIRKTNLPFLIHLIVLKRTHYFMY